LNNLWFKDINDDVLLVNENIIRARAGLFMVLPIFMAFTFFDFNSMFTTQWVVDNLTANSDFMDTDEESRQIYMVEAIKRTYDYTLQTVILTYALFEILMGMSKWTSRFSPTVLISVFLMKNKRPNYTGYAPKRFAWGIGAVFISVCILFFNPMMFGTLIMVPLYMALSLLFLCSIFIWMELSFGYCIGCSIHSLLVKVGIFKNECYECNDIG